MNLLNFFRRFPDEESCKKLILKMRMKEGVTCKHCGNNEHYWLPTKEQFQCKDCRFRTTLRSGTVMESSKLPYQYWLAAMHLMTVTKKSISALEMQRQLGHKRYQPIWEMMHKIRAVMGKRDSLYQLDEYVELDEGFFESVKEKQIDENSGKKKPNKRGRGSNRQTKVLVMASTGFDHIHTKLRQKHRPNSSLRYIKMVVLDDLKSTTINSQVKEKIRPEAIAITDGYRSYNRLKELLTHHLVENIPAHKAHKLLPWVHTIISNAKRNLLCFFHSIKDEYYQNYLNEFCYKTNRRYFREKLFDRLLIASISTTWY